MSKPRSQVRKLEKADAEIFAACMELCGAIADCRVVALVGLDRVHGLFLLPGPGVGAGLFRELGAADWDKMARMAEEHLA